MAIYPGAIPALPTDGTLNTEDFVAEVRAALTELGINPSAAFTDVVSRFTAAENRITAVEGAAPTSAGVEVASATQTVGHDIKNQASGQTVHSDVSGASIAVGAQTRAYNIIVPLTAVAVTGASFTGPKISQCFVRIVNSAGTETLTSATIPIVMPISGAFNYTGTTVLMGRVAAGRAATTWKLQARANATVDTNVTSFALWGGAELQTPPTGNPAPPIFMQAITI